VPDAFRHRIRVRYAEIDGQGVVFNAHWLTYFDDSCTRFVESLGFGPEFWTHEFDVMLVRAVLEWTSSARFDDWIDVDVVPTRLGTKSFDLRYGGTRRASMAGRCARRPSPTSRCGRARTRRSRSPRPCAARWRRAGPVTTARSRTDLRLCRRRPGARTVGEERDGGSP